MRMREVSALVVIESTATLPPQMYMSSAYGNACPDADWANDDAARSSTVSLLVSPENETIKRTGASSRARLRVSAAGMPWITFHRHDRRGKARGSKSVRNPISEALPCAVAFSTTTPSSTTVEYSVSFFVRDSGICCHPAGGAPACAVEKRGISGADCANAVPASAATQKAHRAALTAAFPSRISSCRCEGGKWSSALHARRGPRRARGRFDRDRVRGP